MNQKILNRNFQHPADGWYHIEVKGHHPNREAGVSAGARGAYFTVGAA